MARSLHRQIRRTAYRRKPMRPGTRWVNAFVAATVGGGWVLWLFFDWLLVPEACTGCVEGSWAIALSVIGSIILGAIIATLVVLLEARNSNAPPLGWRSRLRERDRRGGRYR